MRLVEWARRRCKDKNSKWYPYYGAKGITCDLTAKDLEAIWTRDKADQLRKPSLDRIDSNRGYTQDNVRIIEFTANSMLAHCRSFRFLFEDKDTEDIFGDDVSSRQEGVPA
jgi:hypothetical protein